ncbi:MAG: glycerophosphodiester phosphodiesterase [Armatimonadetes bacterium]|nr:glycerophosphodiester phosphodiesterase [Armatimonadota bacterium]
MSLLLVGIAAVSLSAGGSVERPEIIAHRGASHDAPENTIAAIKLAWKQNANAVEIDIWQSADGRILISHDRSTKRITGVDMDIPETSSDELRKLDAGAFKGEAFRGEKLPFLEEVIDALPPRKKLYVEVKSGPEVLPELKKTIDSSRKRKQIVIIGFDLQTMTRAKKLLPQTPVFWLRGAVKDASSGKVVPFGEEVVRQTRENGLDGVDLQSPGISADTVRIAQASGLNVVAWTVDDPQEALRLSEIGVKGITTNRPALLLKALAEATSARP